MDGHLRFFLANCILLGLAITLAAGSESRKEIQTKLLAQHLGSESRPVKNHSTPVKVTVGLALINLDELDEENEILYTNMWLRELWHDEFLQWNPQDHDNITTMRMKLSEIWRPDIEIYNKRRETSVGDVFGVVYNDGTVLHIPPASLATQCYVDVTYFPFDTQTCHIKMGSWVYDGSKVDIEFYEGQEMIDLSDYQVNQKWSIVSNKAKRNDRYYPCCVENYPDLTFNLTLKRNPGYYTYLFAGPVVLLSLLAPFVYLLPPADPQKMSLGSGILFCFTIFFLSLTHAMPGMHNSTPLIVKYYMAMYVLLCIALALATLVSNLARRTFTLKSPPDILKKIFISCLGRCLCVSPDMYGDVCQGDESSGEAGLVKRQDSSTNVANKEWLLLATVIDRLLFFVYLILTIVLTIIMLNAYPRVTSDLE